MFKIGDRVKCIKVGGIIGVAGINPPLTFNKEYIVYNIYIHDCGVILLDVGIETNISKSNCCGCKDSFLTNGIHWCSATRFIKVQEAIQYRTVTTEITVEEPVLN